MILDQRWTAEPRELGFPAVLRSRRAIVIVATSMVFSLAVSIALASEVGPNDFRISQMGPDGITGFSGISPAVAYNSQDDRFLVVWHGDHGTDGETEIYGRLIRSDGSPIGPQFRISDMGPNGDADYDALNAAVAYNAVDNEFLVVWRGDDDTGVNADDEFEIFGQRLHGNTGFHLGTNDFLISDVGPLGSVANGASDPDVTYNSTNNQYLVVWSADEGLGGLANDEHEIYGQRLSSTGGEIGTNDFRISQMGPDGNASYDAFGSAVAYNSIANEYLVVWYGDDSTLPLVDNEDEIFGQRLSAVGGAVGADDFRISDMGPNGDPDLGAFHPDVAHNPGSNEFLVVWEGDDNVTTVDEEFEVFGQRLSATGGSSGENDFRISDMGPDGDPSYYGSQPAVAYDPGGGGYLAVWAGDEETAPTVHEVEAYGQRLSATGGGVGSNDFRISDMGPDGDTGFFGGALAVASGDPNLVVWYGEDNTPPLVDNEYEIFGQLLGDAGGMPVGDDTVGLVDVSQGIWHLRDSSGAITSFWYGNPGDLPIAGDWDGDGVATPGLYRQSDGFFYSRNSNSTGIADSECFAGNPEDVPVVGDWDGDGDDNLGIYRPSEQKFYLFTVTCTGSPMGAAQIELLFGNPGDKPVAGDWDGDGIDEVGLHRESTGFFYWRNTLDTGIASGEIFFGDPADRFASGDWGIVDNIDTPTVFRPSNSVFYFRHTLTQGIADSQFTWNAAGSGWLPVSGDFGLD
jgi:hypothetical protein